MGLDLIYIKGQTPIDEDEKADLKIKTISTRGELDEFEQKNIESAVEWTMMNKFSFQKILTIDFIKLVHKKMFSEIWRWAGDFRKTNKNLGVNKYLIGPELKQLVDDCIYWIENNVYSDDEIAIRFSHRLVSIHPFPNGNGRHSRLCADILVSHSLKQNVFTWGSIRLSDHGAARQMYLSALREADLGDISSLIEFARL